MKARFYIILLVICALVDDLISLCIPPDFRYQTVTLVPHFCFIAMLVITVSRSWLDRVLIGCLVGILTDYFFTISFPTYFLLYGLLAFLAGLAYPYMEEDSKTEALILWGITIFVDLIPFGFCKWIGWIDVPIQTWFLHNEFVTMTGNGVTVCLLMYIVHVYDRYELIQSVRRKKKEKKKLSKLKLARK